MGATSRTWAEKLGPAITAIIEDYDHRREPFAQSIGITTEITKRLDSKRERALFLTLTTALNRQRDAERLYYKFERLWDEEPWIFEPDSVVMHHDLSDLVDLFEAEGTRFPKEDAKVWYEISRTLFWDYDSNPMNLFEEHDYNMQSIADHVRTASGEPSLFKHEMKFPALRGDKIRPVWLRLISRQVTPLQEKSGSDVSVDTHILEITNRICGTSFSNSEADKERIREFWRRACATVDVDPVEIDGPLWYVNRNWNEWGKRYLRSKLQAVDLDFGDIDPDESTQYSDDRQTVPAMTSFPDTESWMEAVAESLKIEVQHVEAIVEQIHDFQDTERPSTAPFTSPTSPNIDQTVHTAIMQLLEDYHHSRGPFDESHRHHPVDALVGSIPFETSREKSLFLTLATALNYRRDPDTLFSQCRALYESPETRWIYFPEILVGEERYDELVEVFEGRGQYADHPFLSKESVIKTPRDANVWYANAYTFFTDYESNPVALLEDLDYDAVSLSAYLDYGRREAPPRPAIETKLKHPNLEIDKVGPQWLRIVHETIHPLEKIDEIDGLPFLVDNNVTRVTNHLLGTDYSADRDGTEIQHLWRSFCEQHGLAVVNVDRPLWILGQTWTDGGRDYVNQLLEA